MAQYSLDFKPTTDYRVYAQPSPTGFFGLSHLRAFGAGAVDPYAQAQVEQPLILDFSLVKVWDIAALLWLVIALQHYRQAGVSFRLKLPEGDPEKHKTSDRDEYDKSADYLRRWAFRNALLNLSPDPETLLVPEQQAYFSPPEPRRFYKERSQADETGVLQSLISRRLVHIRNLAGPPRSGKSSISNDRITECIADFQSARMGDILHVQCGINKRDADLFAEHLLTEALLNVREHPNASIGLIALSTLGAVNQLVLAVADNGDSIPSTIFPAYCADHLEMVNRGSVRYNKDLLAPAQRAELIHYATQPGVTRKIPFLDKSKQIGMGLTYIREDTVNTFKGRLRIVADNVIVTYEPDSSDPFTWREWGHSWKGNLLRITIPLSPST